MIQKIFFILIFVLGAAGMASAQGDDDLPEDGSRVESLRVAFITRYLQLDPKEAETFWPLYNEYREEQQKIRKQHRANRDWLSMDDQQLEDALDQQLQLEQEELLLKQRFFKQLKGVLPIRKVAMLLKAESEFKKRLLQEIRSRRRGMRGN